MTGALDHVEIIAKIPVCHWAAALTRLDAGTVRFPAIGIYSMACYLACYLGVAADAFTQFSTC